MKKILLDYDNTICNLSKGMFERWNNLKEFNKVFISLSHITEYNLVNCLHNRGYSIEESKFMLNKFWKQKNIYQDNYYDMPCKYIISLILQRFKKEGYFIELNSLCPSKEFLISKIQRINNDYALLDIIDSINISLFDSNSDKLKSFDYDIIFEDNPIYIEEYLKNNTKGTVFMPLWKYNEHLKGTSRIYTIS